MVRSKRGKNNRRPTSPGHFKLTCITYGILLTAGGLWLVFNVDGVSTGIGIFLFLFGALALTGGVLEGMNLPDHAPYKWLPHQKIAPADRRDRDHSPRTGRAPSGNTEWVTFTRWEVSSGKQGPHPKAIWFPDSSTVMLGAWNAILYEVASWLWSADKLTEPVFSGPKLFIINIEPFHSSGQPFQDAKQISGSPWYVERSTGGGSAYRNFPITLLRECRVDPNSVWIRTG